MPTLRSALRAFLDGWRSDIAPTWSDLLEGVEPAYDAVDAHLQLREDEVIFPGRKGHEPPGAPAGSHVFRALDEIDPAEVRAVVLGQDPYPDVDRSTGRARPRQATGRAFEQGNLTSWDGYVASSLRSIVRCAAHARSGESGYVEDSDGWGRLTEDLHSGRLELEAPGALFDHWQRQGVLFLNTGLTLTRYERGGHAHQRDGHIPLWAPVVAALAVRLARRDDTLLVFLSWGSFARRFLADAGLFRSEDDPTVAAGFPNTAASVRSHPSYLPNFLVEGPNALLQANEALVDLNADPIDW